jgi:outer membrane lipoprotein-sorting protein
LLVLLVVCVPLTGCTGLIADDPDGPPSAETAEERYRSIDTVRASVVTVVENETGTTRRRAELIRRPTAGERWRRTVAPTADRGDLTVSNGTVTWLYDESEGNVTRIDGAGFEGANGTYAEYLGRLFAAVDGGGDGDDGSGSVGVSPLPVVPSTPSAPPATATNGTVGQFSVSYEGTTAVGNRTAYVLELTPPGDADGEFATLNQTLYLDTEHLYPLRQRMAYRYEGNVTQYTVTHRNVSFGGDVSPGRFTFDPPANATIEDVALPDSTTYDSLDALREDASMAVPSPDVPDGFSFESGRRTVSSEQNYTLLSLTYSNGTGTVSVSKYNRTDLYNGTGSGGESIRLDGRNATYNEFGTARTVGWVCADAGRRYTVSTTLVPKSTLLDVAASIDCGSDGESSDRAANASAEDERSRIDQGRAYSE